MQWTTCACDCLLLEEELLHRSWHRDNEEAEEVSDETVAGSDEVEADANKTESHAANTPLQYRQTRSSVHSTLHF